MRNALRSHGFWQGLIVALMPCAVWFITGNAGATAIVAGMGAAVILTGIAYQITVRRSIQKTLEMYRQATGRELRCRGMGLRYYLLCARRAIKEMSRLIAAQARQQEQMRKAILSLKHPVLILDSRQKIEIANPPAQELLGARPGLSLSQCPASAVEFLDAVKKAWETRKPVVAEFQLLRPERRWLRAESIVLAPDRLLVILDDITCLKELEQTKSRIVSGVSHQLRTPLTVIAGYLEMAGDPDASQEARQKALAVARKHTNKLAKLVDDVISLSKMEYQKPQSKPTDLSKLLLDAAEVYQAKARQKGVEFSVELGPGLEQVWVDPKAVQAIAVNLLDNAVKFTPSGGKVVLQALVQEDLLVIEVKDTGPGMTPEELNKIFERFYTGSHPEAGFGLGLALVKWAAAVQGGEVKVESRVGQGSNFSVRIPLKSVPD